MEGSTCVSSPPGGAIKCPSHIYTHTHTLHTRRLIWSSFAWNHFIPLMNSEMILLMGRALKPALVIIWKLWDMRTEKLTKTGTFIADNRGFKENLWRDIESLKKLHTCSSTWSPAIDLFRKDLVKELKQAHPKVKGFISLTPNRIGWHMRNESWRI